MYRFLILQRAYTWDAKNTAKCERTATHCHALETSRCIHIGTGRTVSGPSFRINFSRLSANLEEYSSSLSAESHKNVKTQVRILLRTTSYEPVNSSELLRLVDAFSTLLLHTKRQCSKSYMVNDTANSEGNQHATQNWQVGQTRYGAVSTCK